MIWNIHRNLFFAASLAAYVFLLPQLALSDLNCGHDDDENGSITSCAAASLDLDHDGITSNGSAGQAGDTTVDSNNSKFQEGPGAIVDAGGGLVKISKADGTYTTAKAESALTAADIDPRAQGTIRFYSTLASTSVGCGAYSSPCDYRCAFNSGLSCYVAPNTTNNVNYLLSGIYNTTWSSAPARMMYVDGIAGTSDHPIFWVGSPLSSGVTIKSPGTTSASATVPIQLDNAADNWIFRNLKVGDGYATTGVYFNGNDSSEFMYGKIFSVNGCAGGCGNNVSGVTINGGNNNIIRQNIIKDTFDTAANTNENNTGIVIFSGTGNKILFNSLFNTSTTSEVSIKNKHGQASAVIIIIGNHIYNYRRAAIGWNTGGATIKRNFIKFPSGNAPGFCFDQHDWSGTPFFDSVSVVQYNECVNGGAYINFQPGGTASSGAIGNPYVRFLNNAIVDNATTYAYEDGSHHAMYQICFRCTDSELSNINGKDVIDENCDWNTASTDIKTTVGGDTGPGAGGANYATYPAWLGIGKNPNGFNSDPQCQADGACIGEDCAEIGVGVFGDLVGVGSSTTTSSTTTTTSTTTTGGSSTTFVVSAGQLGTGRRQAR